jgi:hypothetical protein
LVLLLGVLSGKKYLLFYQEEFQAREAFVASKGGGRVGTSALFQDGLDWP